KKTKLLVAYLILAVLFIIIALDAIIIGLLIYLKYPSWVDYILYGHSLYDDPSDIYFIPSWPIIYQLTIRLTLFIAPVISLIVLLGSLTSISMLRRGGVSVANLMEAVPLDMHS